MKNLIVGLVFLLVLSAGSVLAGTTEQEIFSDGMLKDGAVVVRFVCLDGHLFTVASNGRGVSVIQVFERDRTGQGAFSAPAKCK